MDEPDEYDEMAEAVVKLERRRWEEKRQEMADFLIREKKLSHNGAHKAVKNFIDSMLLVAEVGAQEAARKAREKANDSRNPR